MSLVASGASPENSLVTGSPRPLLPRNSAANLANRNATAGIMRSLTASLVKTGGVFEKYSARDIDDSRPMKSAPHRQCCQTALPDRQTMSEPAALAIPAHDVEAPIQSAVSL